MSLWYTCLCQSSELREMLLLLSEQNVLKLPMVYHVSPQTNGTLKPRTFFFVGTEVLCPVKLPEVMAVFGLRARPWTSHWFIVWKLTTVSLLCLWFEKEPSTLSLGEARNMLTLKEGRMDIFVQFLLLSFHDRSLSINPIISCLYQVVTTAQQVLGQQLHRWVTNPYTAQGLRLLSTTSVFGESHRTSLSFLSSSE